MRIGADVIQHVAALARLEVPEDRIPALSEELSAVLDYVDQISAFETGDETPARDPGVPSPRRADQAHEPYGTQLIDLAADRDGNLVRVARVVPKS